MQKELENHAFIDGQNLYKGAENLNWELDYMRLRIHLKETYGVKKAFIFLGYLKKHEPLYKYLRKCEFELIFKEVTHDKHGKAKGNVDVLMTLHALLKTGAYRGAVIITSDGDFAPLVEHLLSINKFNRILSPEYETCSWLLRKYAKNKVDYLNKAEKKLKKHP